MKHTQMTRDATKTDGTKLIGVPPAKTCKPPGSSKHRKLQKDAGVVVDVVVDVVLVVFVVVVVLIVVVVLVVVVVIVVLVVLVVLVMLMVLEVLVDVVAVDVADVGGPAINGCLVRLKHASAEAALLNGWNAICSASQLVAGASANSFTRCSIERSVTVATMSDFRHRIMY